MGQTSIQSKLSQAEKARAFAQLLQQHQLDGYYVPPEDEHLNEYLPHNKKRIEWFSGFTGESAPMLALASKAIVYVDGRFHLQVDAEVDGTYVQAVKLTPDQSGGQMIVQNLKAEGLQSGVIGYDPFLVTPNRLYELKRHTEHLGLACTWKPVEGNLIDAIWDNRPDMPDTPAFILEGHIAGISVEDKLTSIRAQMKQQGAQLLPLTKLDQIAWLYNIRGRDIPFNPVFESYALITPDKAYWFAPMNKITSQVHSTLQAAGVEIKPYSEYLPLLILEASRLSNGKPAVTWVDESYITQATLNALESKVTWLKYPNPVAVTKDIKNPVEIDRMKLANARASRAIIRHLAWVDAQFTAGTVLNEETLRSNIEKYYAEEPEFFELSFPTIPGVGANSAIIHYSHADPNQVAHDGDFYLIDSGCQYLGGTTDTTRTTVIGTPKPDQIARYTAVLKAHIACGNLKFPEGTTGAQIDAVCREPLWQAGMDFAHGTGHGVGPFMDVHAGRHRISKVGRVAFEPGMITSIEPGYYEKDWGGIRLENLYVVTTDTTRPPFMGRAFLGFESLTFVPFEKKLINVSALTQAEKDWLRAHYQQIQDKFSATLNDTEKAWLQNQCQI